MTIIPQQEDYILIGGVYLPNTNKRKLITLVGWCHGGGTARSTMRKPSESFGYSPSTGKNFIAKALKVKSQVDNRFTIGYGDNDVGQGVSTAIINPIYYGNPDATALSQGAAIVVGPDPDSQKASFEQSIDFITPSSKFLFCEGFGVSTVCTVHIFGYEEPN